MDPVIIGLGIQFAMILAALVWHQGRVRSDAVLNRHVVSELTQAVRQLSAALQDLDDKLDGHDSRITWLEAKQSVKRDVEHG